MKFPQFSELPKRVASIASACLMAALLFFSGSVAHAKSTAPSAWIAIETGRHLPGLVQVSNFSESGVAYTSVKTTRYDRLSKGRLRRPLFGYP